MATLSGNPREDLIIKLHPEDLKGLEHDNMLCMNLLDFILHLTCMHYRDANDINYCLGGTVTRQFFPRMLIPISQPTSEKIKKAFYIYSISERAPLLDHPRY